MNDLSINKVTAALNKQLKIHFPQINRKTEPIEQGLGDKPCFFVNLLNAAQEHELDRRYKRYHSFDIHYFGKSNKEMWAMVNELYEVMELVPYGDSFIRGENMSGEVFGGIMHFFVDYDMHGSKEKEDIPKMKHLEHGLSVKEGLDDYRK